MLTFDKDIDYIPKKYFFQYSLFYMALHYPNILVEFTEYLDSLIKNSDGNNDVSF